MASSAWKVEMFPPLLLRLLNYALPSNPFIQCQMNKLWIVRREYFLYIAHNRIHSLADDKRKIYHQWHGRQTSSEHETDSSTKRHSCHRNAIVKSRIRNACTSARRYKLCPMNHATDCTTSEMFCWRLIRLPPSLSANKKVPTSMKSPASSTLSICLSLTLDYKHK